jgi:hypothetical protein
MSDLDIAWSIFKNTGNIEAYFLYRDIAGESFNIELYNRMGESQNGGSAF